MQSNNKAMEEERKLVAIMFTDIQGSCKLMERDEQATIKMIEEQNELIDRLTEKWNGRVAKSTGDGVMAEFASAVNAVRCGIEIQEEIREYNRNRDESRRLLVRIGIHLGDVVIKEKDTYGEGVNLAARIEPLAKPGEICISRIVYEQVKGKVPAEIKGPGRKRLKNIEKPVEVYSVIPWKTGGESRRTKKTSRIRTPRIPRKIAVIMVVILAAATGVYLRFGTVKQEPPAKSIAVMPFDHESDGLWTEGLFPFILTSYLERLHDIRVLREERKQEVLQILDQDESALRDLSVAQELCQRAGIGTMVTGNICRENGIFRVRGLILDVSTLSIVDSITATQEGEEDLLNVIESLARDIAVDIQPSIARSMNQENSSFRFSSSLEANEHFMEARKNLRIHNFEVAKLSFEMATEADSAFALAYAYLASLTFENEELIEKALRHKDRAADRDQLYITACIAKAEGDVKEAVKAYKKLVALYPGDEEARYQLGCCYERSEMFSEAIREYEEVTRLNPAYADAYRRSGYIYRTTGSFEKAVKYYDRYRKLSDPEDPKVHMTFVELHRCLGEYDKAIQEFELAQDKCPDFEIFRLGRIYVEVGRYDDAIECFRHYISQHGLPQLQAMGRKDLALTYLAREEYDRAIEEAETSLSLYPGYASAMWVMGISHSRKGELAKGQHKAQELRDLGQQVYYYHLMGEVSLGQSAFDRAADYFSHAVSTCAAEANPFFIDAMAGAYFRKGDLDRAVRECKQALQYNPNYAHSRFMLAKAYREQGATDAAIQEYQRFLEIWKDADHDLPELREARESIQELQGGGQAL